MGVGEFSGRNVLILISSSNNKKSQFDDHYRILNKFGATDAIRLDGSTAAALYFNGDKIKGHLNPIRLKPYVGDARNIMYALTVTRQPLIQPVSRIDFVDVDIRRVINIGIRNNFSGRLSSEKPITKITLEVRKPDGTVIIDGEFPQPSDTYEKDLSVFSFGTETYINQLGRYALTFAVEDSTGNEERRSFTVEVIPNITDMMVSPLVTFIEEPSYVTVSGRKLDADIRATIGTDQTPCDPTSQSDREATFLCTTYLAGSYPIEFRYRNSIGDFFDLYEDRIRYVECTSGETETESCGFIANGENFKTRTCGSLGKWGDFGMCAISCNDGYRLSGNECVVDNSSQVCTPDATETRSCSIPNGTGIDTRRCASDGMSWGAYEGCQVESCDAGYVISGNSCVEENTNETYEFFLTNARLDKSTIEAGGTIKASVTSNYSGNVLDADMGTVKIGYYLSFDTSLDENDTLLAEDTSGLGSDDTSDNEKADLTIPDTTAAGEHYILFAINQDNKFPESDESNNVEFVKFEVTNDAVDQYDFYIENAKLNKTSAYPGDEITASMDVHYSGNVLNANMDSVVSAYYLIALDSNNNTVYEERLGTDSSSLGSDDTSDSESLTFNLPSTLDQGKYYVAFIADYEDVFSETNEKNNAEAASIQVQGETLVPSITALDPASPKVYPTGSFTRRTAYISGANFETGASVKMCWSTDCSTLKCWIRQWNILFRGAIKYFNQDLFFAGGHARQLEYYCYESGGRGQQRVQL